MAAGRLGTQTQDVRVGMRTGDTPADERRAFGKHPPDILVTTPESLYLLLTSQAREALRGIEWVIIDEIHALANTKRGAHLALSLERLATLTDTPPQRIGLSATQRPLSAVAAFLGGREGGGNGDGPSPARPVTIVDAGIRKPLELQVVVPVEDMSRLGEAIPLDEAPGWCRGRAGGADQHLAPGLSTAAGAHPGPPLHDRVHQLPPARGTSRAEAQRAGRRGHRESPPRQSRPGAAADHRGGAQGRAAAGARGHQQPGAGHRHGCRGPRHPGRVAAVGRARPPARGSGGAQRGGLQQGRDLPQVPRRPPGVRRGHEADARGRHRAHRHPAQPAGHPRPAAGRHAPRSAPWAADELYALARRAENFAELGRESFEAVLGMLAGQYPADEFAELKPRVIWDRVDEHGPGTTGRADRGGHLRRHDPGPRPVPGLPRG